MNDSYMHIAYVAAVFGSAFLLGYFIGRIRAKTHPLFFGPVYRHVKTSGLYRVLLHGLFERDTVKCVVYKKLDGADAGTVWVRDYNEFYDGRFEYVKLA